MSGKAKKKQGFYSFSRVQPILGHRPQIVQMSGKAKKKQGFLEPHP